MVLLPDDAELSLIAGDRGVDGAGPVVDAAGQGLDVVEALVAEPHGDGEGTDAVVAHDDDRLVGVELAWARDGNSPMGIRSESGRLAVSNSQGSRTSSRSGGLGCLRNWRKASAVIFGIEHGISIIDLIRHQG